MAPELTSSGNGMSRDDASETGDFCNEPRQHPTREERLQKYKIQCDNLVTYLTTNICPPNLNKKEVRNLKNQAKTHQWDHKSKILYLKVHSGLIHVYSV